MFWWLTAAVGVIGFGYALSSPPWRGPASVSFDGRRFRNRIPTVRDPRAGLREGFGRRPGAAPPDPPQPPPRAREDDPRVTWVGHATVLLQVHGRNILTDPVWSRAAGPGGWFGPRRLRPPGVAQADLPPIDVVILSHNHYDHLDVPTLRWLWGRDRPKVVVPLGVGAFVRACGVEVAAELDWETSAEVLPGVHVTGHEARHFSGRGLFDRDRTLWSAFSVRVGGFSTYFAGDTGFGPHFADTGARHGPFDLALLPIGAYLPRWIMAPVHVDPDEAVEAHVGLRAARSLAIHWGSFPLTTEPIDEPPERLRIACARRGLAADVFRTLPHGGSWALGEVSASGTVRSETAP